VTGRGLALVDKNSNGPGSHTWVNTLETSRHKRNFQAGSRKK
jgi:hypothetical protein